MDLVDDTLNLKILRITQWIWLPLLVVTACARPTFPPPTASPSTQAMTSTGTPLPTLTPHPTATLPRSYYPPTPDATQRAIVETLKKTVDPELAALSTSPDGRWRVVRLTYPCKAVGDNPLKENAYEILQAIRTVDSLVFPIDEQYQNCGGVGAYGLGEIRWSTNSRYYYYTDARVGVPDGGGLGWMPTLFRYDTVTHQVETIGPAVLSPDGNEIAAAEVWVNEQWWFSPRALVIWDINGLELTRFETRFGEDTVWGKLHAAWSPTEPALVYIEMECLQRVKCKSWLYFVNRTSGQRELLLQEWTPAIEAVGWESPGQLHLTDANYEKWVFNLSDQSIENLLR